MIPESIHNEKELLRKVATGDRTAFKVLYELYFPMVRGYIVLFEPSREYLDELTQDIFVRIWEKRGMMAEVESFRKYVFMMCRHTVFNYFRSRKVHQQTRELNESDEVGGRNDAEDAMLYKQYFQIVVDAMEKLPPGKRKVLKMSIDDGLSLDEIAAELQISRSGVKNQLYSATAFVREYLREHGEMSVVLFVFLSLFDN